MVSTIFVYGTIRKGDYNHHRSLNGGHEFIGEGILTGYQMYNLGSYPMITPTGNASHEIVGEVYKISDNDANFINRMEMGAGYYPIRVTINMKDGTTRTAIAYAMELGYEYYKKQTLIPSGDWIKYKEANSG